LRATAAKLLHRVVGIADDPEAQEQPLNVVALVEGDREVDDLVDAEPGAADLAGATFTQ
jgi:hypothetical protein